MKSRLHTIAVASMHVLAVVWLVGCGVALGGCNVSAASADPPSANTDGARCIARCHRYGMIVVQWDGRQPWNNGHANNGALGCVCGEVSR